MRGRVFFIFLRCEGGAGHAEGAPGKAKRLRNFPDVRISPSGLRGRRLGPSVEARARLLDGAEAEHARELLARRFPVLHGWLVPWTHRLKGWTTLHYELQFPGGR